VIEYWAMGRMIGGSSSDRSWEFSLHHRVQTVSGSHSNGYQGLFSWGYIGRGVKLTTHLHVMPRSRMYGLIPPLPQYASMAWCLVEVQEQLYLFTFYSLTFT